MTPKQEAAMRQALEALEYVIARDFKFASIAEPIGNSITALHEALAEPVDEPVAWIEHHKGGDNLVWDDPGRKRSALYTAPQLSAWVGLTDEEINALWENTDDRDSWELIMRVQAKLKEKNT